MRSTFHGLEVAKRALFVQQTALNTVSHNIANANTEGYSRQVTDMSEYYPLQYPAISRGTEAGQLGQGVDIKQIQRVRNQFLDYQYRNETKSLGEWTVKQENFARIQAIVNEPSSTGLSTVLNEFFNAWHDLSVSPNSVEARKVVKQRGIELAETVNHMATQFSDLDNDLKTSISAKVNYVNSLLGQLQSLNHQIKVVESLGDQANDLRDRRDLLVDNLAKMADIKVTEASSSYSLSIAGQTVLVDDANPTFLSFDPATGKVSLANGTSLTFGSGEIKGLIDSRTNVQTYFNELNTLVNGVVQGNVKVTMPNDYTFPSGTTTMPFDAVTPNGTVYKKGTPAPASLPKGTVITVAGINGLHQLGYKATDPPTQAPPFFVTTDGSATFTAANLKVNDLIVNDENNLASSDATYTDSSGVQRVVKGNGDIAVMMGQISTQPIDFTSVSSSPILSQGTVEDYFHAVVGQLGVQSQQADRMSKNQEALVRQIDNQRKSVSGVSLDEEMANMVKFQQSYNAAARVVTVLDSILDKVINGMGITR